MSFLKIQVFSVNQANLELFNNTAIPENVTNFYLTELYEFNPTFNPLRWVNKLLDQIVLFCIVLYLNELGQNYSDV